MSILTYPKIEEYRLPHKNILVISCIDLRLTDNLLHFLHHDNLHNRYDHFALAGTSLCTHAAHEHRHRFDPKALKDYDHFKPWKTTLDHHLAIAVKLHDIKDVYIIEHEDCGAYKEFLIDGTGTFSSWDEEYQCHKEFALTLAREIHDKILTKDIVKNSEIVTESYKLSVHCFFIDLRGNVRLMDSLS